MGNIARPQDSKVTAVLCHSGTPRMLSACLACLRRQTVKPFIVLVDLNTSAELLPSVTDQGGPDCHIISFHGDGWRNASQQIAAGIDAGTACVQTEFHYQTHVDVLLKKPDFLERLMDKCTPQYPVVGYEMSDRSFASPDWRGAVGHTATMIYTPSLWKRRWSWSMTRAVYLGGWHWDKMYGWPDTETGFNVQLREDGIAPVLVGHESNDWRYQDADLAHVRSYTARARQPDSLPVQDRGYFKYANALMERAEAGEFYPTF